MRQACSSGRQWILTERGNGAVASCIRLELLRDTLAQAAAILSHADRPARRFTAVRALLQGIRGEHMPTRAARDVWIQIAQSLLRLGGTATAEELDSLGQQLAQLRDVIHAHLANSAG